MVAPKWVTNGPLSTARRDKTHARVVALAPAWVGTIGPSPTRPHGLTEGRLNARQDLAPIHAEPLAPPPLGVMDRSLGNHTPYAGRVVAPMATHLARDGPSGAPEGRVTGPAVIPPRTKRPSIRRPRITRDRPARGKPRTAKTAPPPQGPSPPRGAPRASSPPRRPALVDKAVGRDRKGREGVLADAPRPPSGPASNPAAPPTGPRGPTSSLAGAPKDVGPARPTAGRAPIGVGRAWEESTAPRIVADHARALSGGRPDHPSAGPHSKSRAPSAQAAQSGRAESPSLSSPNAAAV